MQTTKGSMRWVLLVMVMALGACSSTADTADVLADAAGPDTGAPASAVDAGGAVAQLVGRWCSSFAELDLNANGTYGETVVATGAQSSGTWASDGTTYLNFIGPDGLAGAGDTIVALTATTLTVRNDIAGTQVFTRCPAP